MKYLNDIIKRVCEGNHFPNPKEELNKTRKSLGDKLYEFFDKEFNTIIKYKQVRDITLTKDVLDNLEESGYYIKYLRHVYENIMKIVEEEKSNNYNM